MIAWFQRLSIGTKEVLFQLALHAVVLAFYSIDRKDPGIDAQKIVYFVQYALAALVVNYVLLPRYFYTKRYTAFFIGAALVVLAVIVSEELLLESIFFPDTRAKGFPSLLFTMSQVLPLILILSGFKFAWDALRRQYMVEELTSAVRESELQFLKSQINPHFLFNNLNNLYAYAIENSPKTPELILELSGFLRYMLYDCRDPYVPLEKEMEQLHNFISISEMQVEDRGSVNFSTHNIRPGYSIAPLILISFVENAFKHSVASQSDGIWIDVHIELEEQGKLLFSCQNSYLEQSNTDNLSKGIGLENVQKRLNLLYPGAAHRLSIEKTADQYHITLLLDLNVAAL